MKRWLVACSLMTVAAPAAAEDVPTPVPGPVAVTVTASATRRGHAAVNVLDRTPAGWCAGRRKPATLTLELAAPVHVHEIRIDTGLDDVARYVPDTVTVRVRDGAGGEPRELTGEVAKADGVAAVPVDGKVAAIEIVGVFGDRWSCIEDVSLRFSDYVVPLVPTSAEAIAALPAAIDGVREALASCDATAIAAAFAFPLVYTERIVSDHVPTTTRKKYRRARDLVKACKKELLPEVRPPSDWMAVKKHRIAGLIAREGDDLLDYELELVWKKGRWRVAEWSGSATFVH